ncbi:hypothetical protein FVE85_5078 [Porphyridium purpureum]|uniref:F-box domain-containing protein n=1 Tax=Porphyridium purpureum TaxID=35688 RepID=A0A5J4Z3I2_PORPP|nr:hypothetical protein FVE85_5078 [Porphyridium purpureum]|eukprot:POR2143..scf295_1
MSMNELPVEVELKILDLVLQDASQLGEMRRVCRRWKVLVESDRSAFLWKRLSLPLAYRDLHIAEKWYRKAIAHGNQQAVFLLSLLYTYGYACACHNVSGSFSVSGAVVL